MPHLRGGCQHSLPREAQSQPCWRRWPQDTVALLPGQRLAWLGTWAVCPGGSGSLPACYKLPGLGWAGLQSCSAPTSRSAERSCSSMSLCSRLSCGCPWQGRRRVSVLCLLYSFLGHICNAVGALLASQLGIQVGKASTLLRPDQPRPGDPQWPAGGLALLPWGAG